MNISIDRLRQFAERKGASSAAMRAAWEAVQAARKSLNLTRADLETHQRHAGRMRDPSSDKPFEVAIKSASERLANAEANHTRHHETWSLDNSLASRGFDFASNAGVKLPLDIQEMFS